MVIHENSSLRPDPKFGYFECAFGIKVCEPNNYVSPLQVSHF